MPNKNYNRGVRKERKIVNGARREGLISFRSAGSHSPIDVCVIDKEKSEIRFIQCKPDSMNKNEKRRIESELGFLNGSFNVSFKVE